ncbi:hypothetical protein D9M69_629430 [compost metagenome]
MPSGCVSRHVKPRRACRLDVATQDQFTSPGTGRVVVNAQAQLHHGVRPRLRQRDFQRAGLARDAAGVGGAGRKTDAAQPAGARYQLANQRARHGATRLRQLGGVGHGDVGGSVEVHAVVLLADVLKFQVPVVLESVYHVDAVDLVELLLGDACTCVHLRPLLL